MKILAFAASNSSKSINRALLEYAAKQLKGHEITLLDINDYEMPLYSSDREENDGIPQLAHDFREKISEADALLISFAEHNGSYTAAFKNLYDWTSRIDMKVYQDKDVIMLATSPGPGGAKNVLSTATGSAPFFGANLIASLAIPSFYEMFDLKTGSFINPDLEKELQKTLSEFTK